MYAITFDMKVDSLKKNYSAKSPGNSYPEVGKVLEYHGFVHKQGSVYFGSANTDAVKTVIATLDLAEKLPWFSLCVSDIRMLRIVDDNDLMPAVIRAASDIAAPRLVASN